MVSISRRKEGTRKTDRMNKRIQRRNKIWEEGINKYTKGRDKKET